ncbi:alkyl hydroperoxide reductase subunit F [Rhodopseudomonas sp. B29]|uniref:alkyl hydroperoxide reductase subunit F n=1 Tax=Rhodopseudomonas sp. B29 TaxID=95607 RepID=UPI0003480FAC|nr:alkyl hydroperoxide reductase subunit F [Rhodopseudomonas sp. B29]
MLDASLKSQIRTYFERITLPIELIPSLDDGAKSAELRGLIEEIASLSEKITVAPDQPDIHTPSFAIHRVGTDISVRFAGLPMGHEFNSLILALLQVGGHPPKEAPELVEAIKSLDGDYNFETYFSLSCQNCPDVVQALNAMSALNPRIKHVAIDGALFQAEVERRQVMAVPSVFLNGEPFAQGRMSLEEIVAKLDTHSVERASRKIAEKAAFDVLVVGGGPAGVAAAIYAARKGVRTGIVAARMGGQVLDTMAIENLISVPHTEGPKLAASLEQQVKSYDVDIMNAQTAVRLIPTVGPDDLLQVELASGATLKSRTVVLSPGARWRQLDIPGENEYRNKGVAYCPHCDGPLFKGKRVAVVGGGNSGVEAAIDLAGIAAHVVLIEFDANLRADAVLQSKLYSLHNVTVITSARTSEVHGDGQKVVGLSYVKRNSDQLQRLEVDGVFVQIGLVPNTDWLKGTVALNTRGEIEVDARGGTAITGVFAAGDATTVPYKQIIVAMGEGAKASLSAFDHLIRTTPVEVLQAAQ